MELIYEWNGIINALEELQEKGVPVRTIITEEIAKIGGLDGFSPSVDVTTIDGGHRVTITDKQGAESFDVMDGETPEKGVDYWTEEDIVEIDSYIESEVAEQIANKIAVTPQMFGAVGDNVTDDTEAFKKCFEHTNIYIPAGNYVISDTIEVLPRTVVRGDGQYQSFINFSNELLFNVQEYASFYDINIGGLGSNEKTAILFPFKFLRIHNVRFRYLNEGVRSNATAVLYNSFNECTFSNVNYPFIFPNAGIFNTTIFSNCEFKNYNTVISTLGTIYAVNFDRCMFEGTGTCVIDTVECASVVFSSCYYENYGKLVSERVVSGNIALRDTWIYEADHIVLSKESPCNLIVKFVDSTIVNSKEEETSHGFIIDGSNLKVDLTGCMSKNKSTTHLFPITTTDIASDFGVAVNCTINGGYLTLDSLPVYNGEVE